MVFIESPVFTRQVGQLLTDDEYAEFQNHLADHPSAGDVIQQTGGLRKVRWSVEGRGGSAMMDKKLFAELVESMTQMGEIVRGERAPSREFHVDATSVKALRRGTGLSQAKFAALLHVEVGTLKNWEQGRREPTGPAKALLTALRRDPVHVLKALAV